MPARQDHSSRRPVEISFEELPGKLQQKYEMACIMYADEPDDSIAAVEDICRKQPGFVAGRLNLGAMRLNNDDTAGARATYEGVRRDFPGEVGAIGGLATVCAVEDRPEEAVRLARQALEQGYRWSPCYSLLADAKEQAGDLAGAAQDFLTAYELAPHDWENLEDYCRLTGRPFSSPASDEPPAEGLDARQLDDLLEFIETQSALPGADGEPAGCDHTFRFARQWAEREGVDPIMLYQYLNAMGAFCDCEACFDIEPEDA